MSCLIPEILFEIGKKIIEDCNSEDATQYGNAGAVFRFILSGKEPLKAMKNVFSSVTVLKLYKNGYNIGWGRGCPQFATESVPKFLQNQIGYSVKELEINCEAQFLQQMYQPFMDKIIDKKQLIKFATEMSGYTEFLDKFLPQFSSTLKHAAIPRYKMSTIICQSLNLQSLTLYDPCVHDFVYYCCKATSLKLCYRDSNFLTEHEFEYLHLSCASPHLPSVKELIIEDSSFVIHTVQFVHIIKYFIALDSVTYDIKTKQGSIPAGSIDEIIYFIDIINDSVKVPSKIICSFSKDNNNCMRSFIYGQHNNFFDDFQCDNSDPEFFCYRKIIATADSKSTLFEIQFCG